MSEHCTCPTPERAESCPMRTDLALLKQTTDTIKKELGEMRVEMKALGVSFGSARDWMNKAIGAVAVLAALGLFTGIGGLIWRAASGG